MSWQPAGWLTPKTNRKSGARITNYDMNRIRSNYNLILSGVYNEPITFNFNSTDKRFVTKEQWDTIIHYAQQLDHFGLKATDKTTYTNFNVLETIALYEYYFRNDDNRKGLSFQMNGFKLGGTQF